jgi:hypothetical protein
MVAAFRRWLFHPIVGDICLHFNRDGRYVFFTGVAHCILDDFDNVRSVLGVCFDHNLVVHNINNLRVCAAQPVVK